LNRQLGDLLKSKIAANPAFKVAMKADTSAPFGVITKVLDAAHIAGIADCPPLWKQANLREFGAMIREIVHYDTPVLRAKGKEVGTITPALKGLVEDLKETMTPHGESAWPRSRLAKRFSWP